jgi:hypothetical protein
MAPRMDELRIPKHQIPAEVTLEGGAPRKVVFYLADFAQSHAGGERLSDLLNGPAEFLPARNEAGDVVLLSRSAIVAVSTEASDEAAETAAWEQVYRHEVEVRLKGGQSMRGAAEYSLEPEHSRILDYLCQPQPFFTLRQGTRLLLVSKRHTLEVSSLDA